MDHLCAIEAECYRPDRTGEVEECPPGGGEFVIELVRSEVVCDSHPGTRRRLVCYLKAGRPQSVLIDEDSSGSNHRVVLLQFVRRLRGSRGPDAAGPRNTPQNYRAAIGVPMTVPITSPEITSSTRRFCWRPWAVSFEAT